VNISYLKIMSVLVPNFPGFLPVPGSIINFWLLFTFVRTKIKVSVLLSLFSLCILAFASSIYHQIFSLKYFIILCLPLLLIICVRSAIPNSVLILRLIFNSLVFLSLASVLNFDFLDIFLKPLFGKSAGISGAGGGIRGIGLIYPEPSHAAPVLILMLHFILINSRAFLRNSNQITLLSLLFFLFYIFRSGSLALYFAVYMSVFLIFYKTHLGKKLFTLFFVGFIVLVGYLLVPEARFFQVFIKLSDLIRSGTLSIEKTALLASGRFIANYVWIVSGLQSIFGLGFDFNVPSFIIYSDSLQVNYKLIGAFDRRGLEGLPVLPRSWLAVTVGAFGYLGILITVFVLYLYSSEIKKSVLGVAPNSIPLIAFAAFYILVVGFPGNPIPWLAFLMAGIRNP
jgi:hypothetical protein